MRVVFYSSIILVTINELVSTLTPSKLKGINKLIVIDKVL